MDAAQIYWTQAKWHKECGRLDSAYVDFLMACEIVVTAIPRCHEFPTLKSSRYSKAWSDYANLKTARLPLPCAPSLC